MNLDPCGSVLFARSIILIECTVWLWCGMWSHTLTYLETKLVGQIDLPFSHCAAIFLRCTVALVSIIVASVQDKSTLVVLKMR